MSERAFPCGFLLCAGWAPSQHGSLGGQRASWRQDRELAFCDLASESLSVTFALPFEAVTKARPSPRLTAAFCTCAPSFTGRDQGSNCQVIRTKGRATPKPRKATSGPTTTTRPYHHLWAVSLAQFSVPSAS